MSRPNKLFVVHQTLYPDIDGGKKISLGRVLEAVEQFNVYVLLINYKGLNSENFRLFLESKGCIYFEINSHVNNKIKRFLNLLSFKPKYQNDLQLTSDDELRLISIIKNNHISNISVETIFLWNVISTIKKTGIVAKIDVVFHNNESLFFKELSKSSMGLYSIFYFFERLKIKKLEDEIFELYKKNNNIFIYFLTKDDCQSYKDRFVNDERIFINRNNIYLPFLISRHVDKEKPFFLFPGSLNFPPNRHAIKYFAQFYSKHHKCIPIYITGEVDDKIKSEFSDYEFIVFTGFLHEQDLAELYSKCLACISPILAGSGVKVKNLECLQLGVPLITTKFASKGLKEKDLLFVSEDSAKSFVEKLDYAQQCLMLDKTL